MNLIGEGWRRLRFLLGRRRFNRELDEEMRLHMELKTRAGIREGMTAEQARRAASVDPIIALRCE